MARLKSRLRRGLTIIELMIVITLIAILAAIAVPHLLLAQMAANEDAVIGSMRSLVTAQQLFYQGRYLSPSEKLYARPFHHLFRFIPNDPQSERALIDQGLAMAHFAHPSGGLPKNGYFFYDTYFFFKGTQSYPLNQRYRFGVFAWPKTHFVSGIYSYYVSNDGHVYRINLGENETLLAQYRFNMADIPPEWQMAPVDSE